MNKGKINWGEKLTSRKLWCAVAAAVAILVTAFFGDELTPETVDVIKTGVGALVAYIFGESFVDIARQLAGRLTGDKTSDEPEQEGGGSDA